MFNDEHKEDYEAIETTYYIIKDKIEELQGDIDDNLLEDEEEIEDTLEEIEFLNQVEDYLAHLRDEYFMWYLEDNE